VIRTPVVYIPEREQLALPISCNVKLLGKGGRPISCNVKLLGKGGRKGLLRQVIVIVVGAVGSVGNA